LKPWYYTKYHDTTLSGTSIACTSEVCMDPYCITDTGNYDEQITEIHKKFYIVIQGEGLTTESSREAIF
jgi:hypothetical protein